MPFDGIMNYGHESFDAVTTASKTSWSSSVDDFDALMGDEDLIADLRRELDQDEIDHLRLSIDETVCELTDDPEEQARAALQLERFYDDFEDQVDDVYQDRIKHLESKGAREFGFEVDEDNVAVTEAVDKLVDWCEEALQNLRDQFADKMRNEIDNLQGDGINVSGATKDLIYADLVDSEVIEQWEPLLF